MSSNHNAYCRNGVTYREDSRRVIVDSVDARTILPEEEHAAEEKTPHQIWAPCERLEWLPEAQAHHSLLRFMSLINSSDLFSDVDISGSQLTDPAEILHSCGPAILEEEPAGGLAEPQSTNEKHAGRNDLNGKRNNPLLVVFGEGLLDTILAIVSRRWTG